MLRSKEVLNRDEDERLLLSHERFRAFLKNSSEAIWCFELEQPVDVSQPVDEQIDLIYSFACLIEANDAMALMYGYEKGDDMIGTRVEDLLPRSKPDSVEFLKHLVSEKYTIVDGETVEYARDGEKRIFLNNILGVIEGGHLVRTWGTHRDITKQKELEEELVRNQNDLQKLAGRLITNQENELRRLARELHDDLTQQLAVMAIEAGNIEAEKGLSEQVVKKVSHIKKQLIRASRSVHNLSRDLHPSIIEDLGLERAIRSECNNFSSRTGVAVIFTPDNIPARIDNDTALSLYRIIQECLTNTYRHAQTKNAYVFLEGLDRHIQLVIRDTGVGFDPDYVKVKAALGLGSMRERVRLVNGEFSITSSPGKGTSVEVKIPLKGD